MKYQIRKLHLSIEKQGLSDIDYRKENTDVIIELIGGENYIATFFPYENLANIIMEIKKKGDFLNGLYFWAEGMVFVKDCSPSTVKKVVKYMMKEGDFEKAFKRL